MKASDFQSIHLNRLWFCLQQESFLKLPETVNYFMDPAHQKALYLALKKADEKPASIEAHFQSLGHMPMGRYFEQLLIYALERDPIYELLAANRQLIVEKQTLGELDLILYNRQSKQREHWEVALKFYLQTAPRAEHDFYLGPSAKDYLAKKMKSLFERQLPLAKHPLIGEEFGALKSRLFLKGMLFFPLSGDATLPKFWNPKAPLGRWIKFQDFSKARFEPSSVFKVLRKPDWMAPYSEQEEPGLSKGKIEEQVLANIEQSGRPQLVARLPSDTPTYREAERFFVAPDVWPPRQATND